MTLQKYLIIFAAVFYLFIHVMKRKTMQKKFRQSPRARNSKCATA